MTNKMNTAKCIYCGTVFETRSRVVECCSAPACGVARNKAVVAVLAERKSLAAARARAPRVAAPVLPVYGDWAMLGLLMKGKRA